MIRPLTPWFITWVTSMALAATPMVARAQAAPNSDTFTLVPNAYVQFDVRAFPGWDVTPGAGRVARDTLELRRARLGVEGTWHRITFEVSVDPQDTDGGFVKDAYAQISIGPRLRLRAGQFKVPGTRDYDVSARDLDLVERTPLAESLGVGRDIGARLDGRSARLRYDIGVFAGDGTGRDDRAGLTLAGRAVLDLPRGLEIGASLSSARTGATDSEPANGPSIQSTSGYRFADGVYVQGRRLRIGADVQWTPGRWRLVAEGLRLHDQRLEQGQDHEDLPAAIGSAFSATVVRRLRTRRDASGNLFANAVLRRPLDVALRYDFIGLDDANGTTAADSVRPRATDIRARAAHGLTLGSTWAVNRYVKLLGNVGAEQFTEKRSAPESGRQGAYLTLGARLQVEWR